MTVLDYLNTYLKELDAVLAIEKQHNPAVTKLYLDASLYLVVRSAECVRILLAEVLSGDDEESYAEYVNLSGDELISRLNMFEARADGIRYLFSVAELFHNNRMLAKQVMEEEYNKIIAGLPELSSFMKDLTPANIQEEIW